MCTSVGTWQLQDHPGAPGTARQESTRTIVSTYDGGTATQPRAPGHERPFTALRAAKHGRLSAASTAPGADIPPATTAGAPGQYCQSAAPRAPGHGRLLAITAGVSGHDRLSAASIATAPSPAGLRRLRQENLPRTPATPNTLIYSHSHQDITHTRTMDRHTTRNAQSRERANPPLSTWWRGARGGAQPHHTWHYPCGCDPSPGEAIRTPTTHQVHPAIQVPPRPRSCSTAVTGFLLRHHSRAPPAAPRRKTYPCQPRPPPHRRAIESGSIAAVVHAVSPVIAAPTPL